MSHTHKEHPHLVSWQQSGATRQARLPLAATAWSPGDTIRTLGILLHGYGDSARNFVECAKAFHIPGVLWVALDGCYGFGSSTPLAEGRMWFDLFDDPYPAIAASTIRINESVAVLCEAIGCPASRVVYVGFSQGGFMSLNMGLRSAPGMGPAAIVSLSGFLLGSSSLPEPDQALRRTPIFLGHGTRDQVVLPLWQFEIADILKSKGFEAVQSHRYSVDHSLHPDEARDVQDFLRRLV